MLPLTNSEQQGVASLDVMQVVQNLPPISVLNILRFYLDKLSYGKHRNNIRALTLTISDKGDENNPTIVSNTLGIHVTCHSQTIIKKVIDELEDFVLTSHHKFVRTGNIYKYAPFILGTLFNNTITSDNIRVDEFLPDGDTVYVRFSVVRDYRSSGERYELKRELLITKQPNGTLKVAGGAASQPLIKSFIREANRKQGPKFSVLNPTIEMTEFSSDNLYEIRSNAETNRNELVLRHGFAFRYGDVMHVNESRPTILFNDGSKLVVLYENIAFRAEGKVHVPISTWDQYCIFTLNEYRGIDVTTVSSKSQLPSSLSLALPPSLPSYDVISGREGLAPMVDDEEQIIEEGYQLPYVKSMLTKETVDAREYEVTNTVINKQLGVFYLVNYEGRWIHSTVNNHKVREMLHAYNLANYLRDNVG